MYVAVQAVDCCSMLPAWCAHFTPHPVPLDVNTTIPPQSATTQGRVRALVGLVLVCVQLKAAKIVELLWQ
jgi:hypothetical protein